MNFAVNYSVPYEKLVQQGLIQSDLVKCPEWDGVVNTAARLGPVCVHFEIAVGRGSVGQLDFDLIARMLSNTQTSHLNCHLSAPAHFEADSSSDRKKLVQSWVEEIHMLRDRVPDIPIVAENLPHAPYIPGSHIGAMPELITEAILKADAYLLLDLSHARISAAYLGWDYQESIAKLPVDRLRELHITGIRPYRSYLTDHFELFPQDWQAAEWARDQICQGFWREPEVVAFEYGGVGDVFGWRTDEKVLAEQVPRLYTLFGNGRQSAN